MADYRDRIIDRELDELATLPAIALEGAKGVGKTASAERRSATVVRLDEPAEREVARLNPARVLRGPGPVLLDEWQQVPEIWNAVRRAVDDGDPPGPFYLTGSATPAAGGGPPERHSGAGRIDTLRMRPMTLVERLGLSPSVSLNDLFDGRTHSIGGQTSLGLDDYTGEIVRSGFPGIRGLSGRALNTRLAGYLDRVIDRDFENELGTRVRRPDTLRRWMAAYAASTATTTSLEKIRGAAASGDSVPAKTTGLAYRDALVRLFILDPVDGWLPGGTHLKRLKQAPKHHLVDPALAVSLLGLSEEQLLKGKGGLARLPRDGIFLGQLFESLATLSVRVLAQAAEARVFHLRTLEGDHEVDLIVENPAGDVVAIEVKLAGTVSDRDCRHLHWLKGKVGDRLRESVVITSGNRAYRRDDGVAVVPLALLGP